MTSQERTSPSGNSYWYKDWKALAVLLLVTFTFWEADHSFFWRDDWNFLSGMREMTPGYLMQDHFGHVMPLTKGLYFLQLVLFGPEADMFALVGLVVMAVTAWFVLTLLLRLTDPTSAWVTTIVLSIHPLLFNHVGWTFEQCISWHLLFQIIAVGSYLRWLETGSIGTLLTTVLFTVMQNYSFGNGLFLPAYFAFTAFIWRGRTKQRKRGGLLFAALFVIFVLGQVAFGGDRATGPSSLEDLLGILSGGLHLLGIDAARWFFIWEGALGPVLPVLGGLLFVSLIILALTRRDRDRHLALFHIGWFLVSFISIPLVRRASLLDQTIPHYYSFLCMLPAGFIAEHALGGRSWWTRVPRKLAVSGAVGLVLLVFLLDRQLMAMVSFRSFRNEQAMMRSLQDGTPYKGFDEPYFRADKDKVEDPLGVYRYWRDRDRFRLPIGYANEPSNWTRTTPLTED